MVIFQMRLLMCERFEAPDQVRARPDCVGGGGEGGAGDLSRGYLSRLHKTSRFFDPVFQPGFRNSKTMLKERQTTPQDHQIRILLEISCIWVL